MFEDDLDGGVLGCEVSLDGDGFVQHGFSIVVGVFGALVGCGALDLLTNDDHREPIPFRTREAI